MSPFMTVVDIIGIWVGLAGALFSFLTWVYARNFFRKSKKPQISGNRGDAALVFNLTGRTDISEQVNTFLQSTPELCGKISNAARLEHSAAYSKIKASLFSVKASSKGRIVTISTDQALTEENVGPYMAEFNRVLNQACQALRTDGVQKIHLFFSGPSVLCTLIGTETKNSFQVALYHFNNGKYLFIGNSNDK